MATKANLITDINGFLTSIVTISKHRNSMNEVVNELFPISENYVQESGDIQYDLTFTKSGNKCLFTGSIKNTTSSIIGNTKLLDIPNSLYYPKEAQIITSVGNTSLNNGKLLVTDASFVGYPNAIYTSTNIGAGNQIIINTSYIVND